MIRQRVVDPCLSSGCRSRRGATLIDVAAGAALLSLILIPSIKMLGESSQILHRMQLQDEILFEAERLMEETKVALCDPALFAGRRGTSDQAVIGNQTSGLRSRVEIQSDLVVNLVTINVLVWNDRNRNTTPDRDESSQTLRTQWSQP